MALPEDDEPTEPGPTAAADAGSDWMALPAGDGATPDGDATPPDEPTEPGPTAAAERNPEGNGRTTDAHQRPSYLEKAMKESW
jgi:hypothetical protein